MYNANRRLLFTLTVVLLLPLTQVIGSEGAAPARSDDLAAQWDFREGVGQYTYDMSGSGNVGVLGISTETDPYDPGWSEGLHNGALEFDGQNDQVNCGNGSSLQFGTGSFSVEAWVHVDGNLTDNLGGILTKYDGDTNKGFFLETISDRRYGGWGRSYGQVSFGMNDGHMNDSWNVAAGRYGTSSQIYDVAVYDGQIYAATSSGDLVQWAPSGWIQTSSHHDYKTVRCLAIYNGRIYGGVSDGGELVEYSGSSMNRVAQQFESQNIVSLAVFNGRLYAGTSPSGMLLEWNGFGAWDMVAEQYSTETSVGQLCVYNGHLYGVTGRYLLKWDGRDSWLRKAEHTSPMNTLAVYNGKLYSANNYLYEWNDASLWLTRSYSMPNGQASTLSVYNGKLYAGTNTGLLYEWNGLDDWVQRAPASNMEHCINSMCVFRGKLYAVTSGQGQLLEWGSGCSVTLDVGLSTGWNQIVGVKDNDLGSLLLYINGKLEAVSPQFTASENDVNCTKHLLVGRGFQDNFFGKIDRIRLFNRSLTASDVEEDYDFYSSEWRPPMPPSSPWIDSGDLFVNISWGYPISNGTNPLIGYRVYKGTAPDALVLFNETDDMSLNFYDTNLTYGTTYYYQVNSYSDAGESISEDLLEATPLGLPSPPLNLSVKSGDVFVNISWERPLMKRGSNITEYRIERGLTLDTFSDLIILGEERIYYNDTIVDNRQTYYYRIFASNDVGESDPSANVSAVPKSLCRTINDLDHHPCDMGAELTWSKSTDKYFRYFNVYRGTRELISGGLMGEYYSNPDMTDLSFQTQDYLIDFDWGTDPPIPRMEDNEFSVRWQGYLRTEISGSYKIIIRADGGVRLWVDNIPLIDAWNDAYYEKLSATVFLITGDHQVRIDYFNKENRSSFRLSWAPPDGDAHIIPTSRLYGYYITFEKIAQTEENTYKDEGLEIGKIYYYFVRAVNDAGESLIGNTVEVYPIGLPDEPADLVLMPGDGYINLTWEQPRDVKGSMIIQYKIFRAEGIQNVVYYANVSGEQLHFNDTDIVNGEAYFYYVIAVNGAGDSEPSTSEMAIPVGKPSSPRNPKVEEHPDGLKITWAASKIPGGADLNGFNVYRSVNGGNRTFIYWVNDFLTLGYIDMDVHPGNNYTYWITTLNEVGESDLSDNVSYYIPSVEVPGDDDDNDEDPDEPQDKEEFPVVPVVIVVVIVLMIVAVVLFFIIRKKQVTKKELMLGPVQVGSVTPAGELDDTFGIFHPDQVQQTEPIVQPIGQEVGYVQQPQQYAGYDQSGQYDSQQEYPQEAYPQQGYAQEGGYPSEQYIQQDQYQQMVQDVYYEEQSPQYDLPPEQQPVEQGYIPQQPDYPQQQDYYQQPVEQQANYPQQGAPDPYYQPEQQEPVGPQNEFFAPPEAVIQPEAQEFSTLPPEQEQPKPSLPDLEDEQ